MTSKRSAGILAPVFALRHDHDFGIGDTRALRELMDWDESGFLNKLFGYSGILAIAPPRCRRFDAVQ